MYKILNPQIGRAWISAEAKLPHQEYPLELTKFQGITNQHTTKQKSDQIKSEYWQGTYVKYP